MVQTSIENGQACIKISDTGIGIAAERIKTLFDPAFTKEQTRVKAGMGLFISQNIIQKHRGQIAVESEVGQGTCFTINLPTDLEIQLNGNTTS